MDDSRAVRFCECGGCLSGYVEKVPQLDVGLTEMLPQIFFVDELGRDEVQILRAPDFMDGQNIWMVECRSASRLLHEPVHALLVLSEVGRKDLQSNGTVKLAVESEIDLSHSASADSGADFVAAEFFA